MKSGGVAGGAGFNGEGFSMLVTLFGTSPGMRPQMPQKRAFSGNSAPQRHLPASVRGDGADMSFLNTCADTMDGQDSAPASLPSCVPVQPAAGSAAGRPAAISPEPGC